MMNGYDEKRGMDEDAFGAKGSVVSAFDAFRVSLCPIHNITHLPHHHF
jgi:hypothetical protein